MAIEFQRWHTELKAGSSQDSPQSLHRTTRDRPDQTELSRWIGGDLEHFTPLRAGEVSAVLVAVWGVPIERLSLQEALESAPDQFDGRFLLDSLKSSRIE